MPERDSLVFRAAVDAATDGLAITDPQGCYIYLNQAHLVMFGFTEEELLGASWRTIYAPGEAMRIEREAFARLATHGSWRGEAVGRHRNGRDVYQEVVLSLLPDGGIICATRDISERREQERRTRLLEARLRRAERTDVLLSLHTSLAHDFGNLIAAIDSVSRLMRQNPEDSEANEARIDTVLKATGQAFDLISSTAPSDRSDISPGTVDVADLLSATISIARSMAPDRVRIDYSGEADEALVLANDILAGRSFLNVIKNGIEAVTGSGAVRVRLATCPSPPLTGASVRRLGPHLPDCQWIVEIEDDGEGMSEERLSAALTHRLSTKTGPFGRGLGLRSVISLSETGLVSVEIQTVEGCGTRVVFRFIGADEETEASVSEADQKLPAL